MTHLQCLCTAFICCATAAPALAAEQQFLMAPPPESGNPFESALRQDVPPRQYGSYQFLGRATLVQPASGVVFADEPAAQDSPARATSNPRDVFESPDVLWGHGRIEQTQYPLDEPPANQAPDEPRWIAPILAPPNRVVDNKPPWLGRGQFQPEFTSVIAAGDALGITSLVLRGIVESPRFKAFSIRPVFGLHAIGGPVSTDLPGQLYDVSVEARMYWPVGEHWLGEFAVAPGIFSDFQNTSSDALRIVGRGLGYYKWSDTLRLAAGVAYLDRQDIALLPLGGVIWTPNPDWRYEILIPRPRITHRYAVDDSHERWIYLAGEFGGGSWAIERSSGAADIATYRDYRLSLGTEFIYKSGATWLLEGGFAFGRQLEYVSGIGDYGPEAAAIIRAALTF